MARTIRKSRLIRLSEKLKKKPVGKKKTTVKKTTRIKSVVPIIIAKKTTDPDSPPSPPRSPTFPTDTFDYNDVSDYFTQIKNADISVDDSFLSLNAMNHTNAHEGKRNKILSDFLACIREKGIYGRMLELVVDKKKGFEHIPRVFRVFRNCGEGTTEGMKLRLLNKMLIDWQALTKKTKITNNKESSSDDELTAAPCPYYQPAVQNVNLRCFFALMKERYDWHYSFERDFSFTGGLVPFLKQLYAKRHLEYGLVCMLHTTYYC